MPLLDENLDFYSVEVIPKELRETVLERFQKADKGSQKRTGLGLAIVKRIVDLHKGDIYLTDGLDDRGLRITVSLPLSE